MSIFNLISLFGGLALFLYGMRLMGDGLKSGSSGALKTALEKVTGNALMGFLLGLVVTAVIQSSTATIVLTSGLVGAGLLSLRQSIGIVLGANVGTTITGQIIRLLDLNGTGSSWTEIFRPTTLAPLACIIGILLIMAVKSRGAETIGGVAMGFGILFTGLLNMTAAVSPLSGSAVFAQVLEQFSRIPVLGFLAGTCVAFLIQSSSATIGILQALCTTGALTFSSIYAIIIGVNIGDCVTTAIVCSIGSKADAKRTGVVHILFNLFASVLIIAALMIGRQAGWLDWVWDMNMTPGTIANVHTIFRLSTSVLLLPLARTFEKLSYIIVKDDKQVGANVDRELEMLDDKFFSSPALALNSAKEAISAMARLSRDGVVKALAVLESFDQEAISIIEENEDHIDRLADAVDNYLIRLSARLGDNAANDTLNYYIQCFSEFERIGDYAVNLTENASDLHERKMSFSDEARQELRVLSQALTEILGCACDSFINGDFELARRVEPVEEAIDDLVATLRENHIARLREGRCKMYAGLTFLDVLINAERIGDQCSNIGISAISMSPSCPTTNHHDYTRYLHQGNDRFFNEQYRLKHAYYFGLLEQGSGAAAGAARAD
ncbi:MAG: Na/Pi cotransporter family protein [Oscillospiraceae bacterium]|jgi:phosphate:Na+ symporter|nr:Na/Pi cotransporter family protein [Oscillospiraceae bacterium]